MPKKRCGAEQIDGAPSDCSVVFAGQVTAAGVPRSGDISAYRLRDVPSLPDDVTCFDEHMLDERGNDQSVACSAKR